MCKELRVANSSLNASPLRAKPAPEDFPLWDGGGEPQNIETEILKLERTGEIYCYYDLVTHTYEHKIGGYPSFCQSGVEPGDDIEFVFQISSDSKINLNIIDSGNLTFWQSRTARSLAMYYDFC
jgi:hypothetical protein